MTNVRQIDELCTTGRHEGSPEAREDMEIRRQLLGALRRIAVHLQTAEVLELRAGRSASPPLAVVLRERAAERRGTARRLRADLVARGVLTYRPRTQPG
ncbi:MAG TPA: hypothetical protein VK402_00080 [Blastococcus sp.]|nr:hypothetical protein [Blastococcus sp.]